MLSDTHRYRLQAQHLLEGAPTGNIASFAGAVVIAMIVHQLSGDPRAIPWAGLIIGLCLIRLAIWQHYRSAIADTRNYRRYLRWYAGLTIATGIGWALVYFMIPVDADKAIIALLIIFFGLTIGAHSLLTAHFPSYASYILPSAILLSYGLARGQEPVYWLLALAVGVFGVTMLLAGRRANHNLLKMALLEENNRHLISKLQHALTRKEMEIARKTRKLATSEEQLRLVIEGAKLGFWDWQYQTGEHAVNDIWLGMLGLDREDIKNDVSDCSARVHPEDKDRVTAVVEAAIRERRPYTVDFRMRHRDGHWVWIQGSGAVVEYDDQDRPLRLCGTHQEITDRKRLENDLLYQASHDPLTGLLNRARLWDLLDTEISRARRYRHELSLLMLDLDHFKPINDRHGHQVGDEVLRHFGQVLRESVRHSDHCLRYGGEEFLIIMPETLPDQARELADRIREATESCCVECGEGDVRCTVSIGIANFPKHGDTPARLLEAADNALYQAKEAGRNRVEIARD